MVHLETWALAQFPYAICNNQLGFSQKKHLFFLETEGHEIVKFCASTKKVLTFENIITKSI